MMKYRASLCLYEVSIINYDNYHYLMHVKYIFLAIYTILFTFCITLGVLSTGNLFPPVPKLEKLKMSQQPVSNEFPLILPVLIIGMMFFLLFFNKVSGRTYASEASFLLTPHE